MFTSSQLFNLPPSHFLSFFPSSFFYRVRRWGLISASYNSAAGNLLSCNPQKSPQRKSVNVGKALCRRPAPSAKPPPNYSSAYLCRVFSSYHHDPAIPFQAEDSFVNSFAFFRLFDICVCRSISTPSGADLRCSIPSPKTRRRINTVSSA